MKNLMTTIRLFLRIPLTLLEILGELRAINTQLEKLGECIARSDGGKYPGIRIESNRHGY